MVTTLYIDFLDPQGQLTPQSAMESGWNSKLIKAFMVMLATCKNEEDPSKNERKRVVTTFSVSARVHFLRFWRNKLTADALSLSVRFSWCTQKQQREPNSIFFMCRDLRTSIYLDDNASINSVPVENRPAHKYLCWVFPWCIWFISKNDDCPCEKSFAIRTDGVSFQIILACFALAAILGHYAA